MIFCLICEEPWIDDDFQCFGCGGWMHYDCYWPAFAGPLEQAKLDRANELSERGGWIREVAEIADELVDSVKIICPACRED